MEKTKVGRMWNATRNKLIKRNHKLNTNVHKVPQSYREPIIFKDECFRIIGAALEVHNQMGSGFLEAVYQEALSIEFNNRNIPFEPQKRLELEYKGQKLQKEYISDFVCFDGVIVELKSQRNTTNIDEAQVINYLKASNFRVGLLINFGNTNRLVWSRFIV